MDTECNHDVRAIVHSQDEQDDPQPTKPDMNKVIFRSMVPSDCEVSVDILSRVADDSPKSYTTCSTKMNNNTILSVIEKAITVVLAR